MAYSVNVHLLRLRLPPSLLSLLLPCCVAACSEAGPVAPDDPPNDAAVIDAPPDAPEVVEAGDASDASDASESLDAADAADALDAAEEPPPAVLRDCDVNTGGIVVQCEDLDGPWFTSAVLSGYDGTGYAVARADGVATTSMSGVVSVPAAGTYQVWARGYEAGADRRWQVEINDVVMAPTHGGDGPGFTWQKAGEIDLDAGEALLRVLDVAAGWEVADAIALSADPNFDPESADRCWRVIEPEHGASMLYEEIMSRTRSYDAALPPPTTVAAWELRAAALREKMTTALGLASPWHDAPANVQLLGQTQLDGYRVERLTFEAFPGFVATANVYVPDGPGPFPAVVSPIGHWDQGKANPTPAARSHALALMGFVSITYDLFGYGERAVLDNQHGVHWPLVLTGHSNAGIQVAEDIRALDYLLSRPDVDPSRIAITGASGGGLATLYTSVVDPRLDVAVPVVYVSQYAELLESGIERCGCSHIPAAASFSNMGELAALFAPKPMTIISGLHDPIFPTLGAQKAEAQARPVYELLDAGDRLQLLTFDAVHDYTQPMREAMYGVLQQYLQDGDGSPIPEPPFDVPGEDVYDCFPGGKVPAGTTTAFDLARSWAEDASASLPGPSSWDADAMRANVSKVLNPPAPHPVSTEHLGVARLDGMDVELFRLGVQPGVVVPGRLLRGSQVDAPVVLIVDDGASRFPGDQALRAAHDVGWTALHVTVRGRGETLWAEYQTMSDNVLLGDSLLGQRAFDISQARLALQSLLGTSNSSMALLALGPEASLGALFAQALWGEFDAVALGPLPSTFFRAFQGALPTMGYVANILSATDIPQTAALASARPLLVHLADDTYAARYPDWGAWLDLHVSLTDSIDLSTGLAWLAAPAPNSSPSHVHSPQQSPWIPLLAPKNEPTP